jgi:transketolase
MLNTSLKLNAHVLDPAVEQVPIRDGFGEGLLTAGERDPNVVALSADLAESTRVAAFAAAHPERFFDVGVAEQNMVTIAAGLGVSGKVPFVASFAVFSPGRNWEQIRTTICYNDANVKITGHHAGVSNGADGATHQALEDIALMRTLPNMKVIVPCDAIEARKATLAAAKLWGPVYLRLERERSPLLTTDATPFTPGKAEIIWRSKRPQVALIACGSALYQALRAARDLEKMKVGTVVVNNHTVKPLDERTLVDLAKKVGAFVCVEHHQVAGGMGSAVAELIARTTPVPIEFVGMQDSFGESGKPHELIAKHAMDTDAVVAAVKRALKRTSHV